MVVEEVAWLVLLQDSMDTGHRSLGRGLVRLGITGGDEAGQGGMHSASARLWGRDDKRIKRAFFFFFCGGSSSWADTSFF